MKAVEEKKHDYASRARAQRDTVKQLEEYLKKLHDEVERWENRPPISVWKKSYNVEDTHAKIRGAEDLLEKAIARAEYLELMAERNPNKDRSFRPKKPDAPAPAPKTQRAAKEEAIGEALSSAHAMHQKVTDLTEEIGKLTYGKAAGQPGSMELAKQKVREREALLRHIDTLAKSPTEASRALESKRGVRRARNPEKYLAKYRAIVEEMEKISPRTLDQQQKLRYSRAQIKKILGESGE